MDLPFFLREEALIFPPSRKPIISSAMLLLSSNLSVRNGGRMLVAEGPISMPKIKRSVTLGRKVFLPRRSIASPAKRIAPRVRRNSAGFIVQVT